ncbi:hypothetical protein LOC71_17225 [Rhodopirellula sp. JC740]|uniref:Uncharacterized protein n=1 Tax=Rhodopirellula halodulae TaxID=2894198 RepID=A0ABS8NKD3_9BACT|nr:hypothetical protein [Rhodopirellula sp. JC740]MCC9644028.1 hypothetical protein [Rhodopirellula sp. JC740]
MPSGSRDEGAGIEGTRDFGRQDVWWVGRHFGVHAESVEGRGKTLDFPGRSSKRFQLFFFAFLTDFFAVFFVDFFTDFLTDFFAAFLMDFFAALAFTAFFTLFFADFLTDFLTDFFLDRAGCDLVVLVGFLAAFLAVFLRAGAPPKAASQPSAYFSLVPVRRIVMNLER